MKKKTYSVIVTLVCVIAIIVVVHFAKCWYTKTFTPSLLPQEKILKFNLADDVGQYDQYAGNIIFNTKDEIKSKVYVYYEIVSDCTILYKDGNTRRVIDYNLRAQDKKENPTKMVEFSGAYVYPLDNPENVTYERYYPQFIREQDTHIARSLYYKLYKSNARVIDWNNVYED